MAPDPKPPGRKRGRPPNASKPTTTASQDRPDEYEADVEEATRPKQRGRPKKSADTTEQPPPQEEAPRRKRGRPSPESKDGDATAAAQPKRKRGRPSLEKQQQNEDEVVEDAVKPKRSKRAKPSEEQQQDEDEAVANAEKPKRGRRAKPTEEEHDEEQPDKDETIENTRKPKRKGRAKATEDEQPEEEQQDKDDAAEDTRKTKQKARTKATENEQPEEDQPEQQQPRKRGRKPAQQQPEETEDPEPAPRKKRRREAPAAEEEPEQEEQTVRRSPRNSLRDLGPEGVHNKGAEGAKSKKKKRSRASDTREEEAENQQDEAQPKKRGRRKGARPSTENEEAPGEQEQQDKTNKHRRRTSKEDAASSSDEELPSPPKPYPHVAPYTRIIKSSTIAAKWTPLTGASLPAASSILTLAHQPILQRTSSTRNRRTHASAALHLVSRRIERKLARGMPFPPASSTGGGGRVGRRRGADADGGRALELDFEAVLDGKTALERQLVPARHAVELLRAEKERMEKAVEDDYEKLRKLEADARAQTRERKDLYRKAHHLIDTPLEPLALQLAGHVESIRGNLQQADGVAPQLARTKAALQDVLHRYLDRGAYEQVVLG
ncbi:hypothetical protein ACHAPT_011533 [Fusarium lateritium]